MNKAEILTIIRKARELLAERWIPWRLGDASGGHCQAGCIWVALGIMECEFGGPAIYISAKSYENYRAVQDFIDATARDLHPELVGCIRPRCGQFWRVHLDDSFDRYPAVFVNNQLGKEAILAVYDEAISRLELAVLCEEEAAKDQFAAQAEADPVEVLA